MVKGAFEMYSARAPLKGDGSEDARNDVSYSLLHRSLFVFGAMMAEEVLDALLAISGEGTARSGLRSSKPGTVYGYGRFCLKTADPWLSQLPGALPAGARVLDIGSGPFMLLGRIALAEGAETSSTVVCAALAAS